MGPARPAWAETPTFADAWTVFAELAANNPETSGRLLHAMAPDLRVICIDSEQLDALPFLAPDCGEDEFAGALAEVAGECSLPFESVYLDLDGAGIPRSDGKGLLDGPGDLRMAGAFVTSYHSTVDVLPVVRYGGRIRSVRGLQSWHWNRDRGEWHYRARIPGTDDIPEPDHGTSLVFAHAIERVLSVLRWLNSYNVEVVEPSVSRQVRRSAERKGAEVALAVRVKQSRRYVAAASLESGIKANYSHRFETRGHYRHYFERKADGGPSQVFERCFAKDPGRVVEIDGKPCFRFWVPPFVKGPIDKPFVPKIRVVDNRR